jgi:AcrR family transcriptional regulator
MTQTLSDNTSLARHRHRLLEGMAQAVAEKGYAETTIADIVRVAAVSRRTFYEHFATKSACLIALYEASSHGALKVLREALDPARDWQDQVELAMAAYFERLAQNPSLVRTLFIEILGLGPEGLAARRRMNDEIADFMLQVINRDRKGRPPLSREMAMAVIGGVNEMVLNAIETGQVERLRELAAPSVQLVRAVARDQA